ncbi:MAG: GNAT family N-acetyltransferase [Parcubacteria group bacterium]|nr:GNAT family N-acetyltransferase [Parcubacteria group bacterium]
MAIQIRRIDPNSESQIKEVAHLLATEIYEEANQWGMKHRWIADLLWGHPWAQTFAAFDGRKLVGAIVWDVSDISEKRVALELDWIAVEEDRRSEGIGARLVRETLPQFVEVPIFRGYELTSIFVIGTEDSKGFFGKVLKPFKTLIIPDVWEYEKPSDQIQVWFWARPEGIQATP